MIFLGLKYTISFKTAKREMTGVSRDVLTLIRNQMPGFSKGQKLISNFILENYDKAAFMTANKLGKTVGVSESTVVRFASELGYDGYPAMQKALQNIIRTKLTTVQRIEMSNDRMGDADILIKLEQYSEIEEIMRSLEFDFKSECDHVFEWHKPSLHLELHKKVVPENDEDLYGYFETGWKFADQIRGVHQFEMSWENFFLYIFVHFTKHYRIAGIGIKHILDLWVVTHTHPNLDMEYICGELKKMGLREFYTNVMQTVSVWFLNGIENKKTELITNIIFSSGQYGTYEQQIVNHAVLAHKGSFVKARFVKLRNGIFLPYKKMKIRYKAVEKCPILLPVMWGVRWLEILLLRRHVFKIQRERSKMMGKKNIEEHQPAIQFVGLYTDR